MKKETIDSNILAHTSWNCKYHIVFAPKYRRKVFFEEKRLEIREILRKLCQWKGVEIIEGEVCPDHIHMLVSIPPKMSVSGFMGYLKGKSALLIFQQCTQVIIKAHGNCNKRNRHSDRCRSHRRNMLLPLQTEEKGRQVHRLSLCLSVFGEL